MPSVFHLGIPGNKGAAEETGEAAFSAGLALARRERAREEKLETEAKEPSGPSDFASHFLLQPHPPLLMSSVSCK